MAKARFHLVVSVQTLQGGPCDVHLAASTSKAEDKKQLVIKKSNAKVSNHYPLIIFISLIAPRLAQNSSHHRNFHPDDSSNLVTSPKILLPHLKQNQI